VPLSDSQAPAGMVSPAAQPRIDTRLTTADESQVPASPSDTRNLDTSAAASMRTLDNGKPSPSAPGKSPVQSTSNPSAGSSTLWDECLAKAGPGRPMTYRHVNHGEADFHMAVYNQGDIVSNTILEKGLWEPKSIADISDHLPRGGTLVDIGANIGFFSLYYAARGNKVYAVEPFTENLRLIETSLCMNPHLRDRVVVIPYGLHTRQSVCSLYQNPSVNLGDTFVKCDGIDDHLLSDDVPAKTDQTLLQYNEDPNTVKLASAEMRPLDEIFYGNGPEHVEPPATVDVLKIDVEGFEPFALKSGSRFFASPAAPKFITGEFSPYMINGIIKHAKETDNMTPRQYLEMINDLGYDIKDEKGAALDASRFDTYITTLQSNKANVDITFSKKF